MLNRIWDWLTNKKVEVTIISRELYWSVYVFPHVLVELPDKRRMCVTGQLGNPGEKIVVNTRDLWKY